MRTAAIIRWLSSVGLSGVATFVAAMIALHVLQPALSPLDDALSYYVHGPYGWLTTIGLITLGVGSLAITAAVAFVVGEPRSYIGVVFLLIWSICAVLGGIFSADPAGNWDKPPSTSGAIHGVAAMIGIASFPVAAVLLTRGLHHARRWNQSSNTMAVLATFVLLSFIVFMASLAPVFMRPGPPFLLGLTERVLFISYLGWLTAVAFGLYRYPSTPDPARTS